MLWLNPVEMGLSHKRTSAWREALTHFAIASNLALILCYSLLSCPPSAIAAEKPKKLPLQAYRVPDNTVVLPHATFYGLRSNPIDSLRLYAATSGGLQATENGGLTWRTISIDGSNAEIFSAALHPAKPEILYVVRRDGLWKSEDGGLTWGSLPHPDSVALSIDVAQSQPDIIYLGTARSGVFKSTNRGNQWMEVSGGLPVARGGGRPEEVRTLIVDPRDSDVVYIAFSQIGVYRTINGGKSWHEFNKGIPIARPVSPPQLSFDRADPGRLFLAFSERIHSHLIKTRIYLLSDNGRWIPVKVGLPDNLVPLALMVDGSMNIAQLWGPDGVWEFPLSSRKK